MKTVKTCSFCGKTIEPGTGVMYVKKDGSILHFCSNKCKKNMIGLGRSPRYVRWTNQYHEIKKMRTKA